MSRKATRLAAVLCAGALTLTGCDAHTHDHSSHDHGEPVPPAGRLTTPAPPPVGAACAPLLAQGGLDHLAGEKLGTAIERIPALSSLAAVLRAANAIGSLNSASNVTFFAPTDEAFAKLPQQHRDELLAGGAAAGEFISLHTTGPRANTDTLATAGVMDFRLNKIAITGEQANLTVGGTARIVCGNVGTEASTIHLVDTVLG